MFKRLSLIAVLVAVAILGSSAISHPESAEAAINCDVLHASSTVLANADAPVYRVNGDGPGLPTPGVAVENGVATTVSWVIYGPGTWTNVILEWSPDGGGTWYTSNFSPPALSCSASGCAASVPIPGTAVVGAITDNAAMFGMPDPTAMTNTVLEVGKTYWMDGVDSTGMYRKVLISCTWAWVETAKTGPNYDDVWNGTPLPGHTVD